MLAVHARSATISSSPVPPLPGVRSDRGFHSTRARAAIPCRASRQSHPYRPVAYLGWARLSRGVDSQLRGVLDSPADMDLSSADDGNPIALDSGRDSGPPSRVRCLVAFPFAAGVLFRTHVEHAAVAGGHDRSRSPTRTSRYGDRIPDHDPRAWLFELCPGATGCAVPRFDRRGHRDVALQALR